MKIWFLSKLLGLGKKSTPQNDEVHYDLDIENFDSINEFWDFITKEEKWYLKYSPYRIKNIEKHLSKLEPLVIERTNKLREKMEFIIEEYFSISLWDQLFINDISDASKFKQFCSNCKKEIQFFQRYPKMICQECNVKKTGFRR